MGQYYVVVNLTKKQYLYPHRFNEGVKLLEFGASGGGTMTGLAILLANSNNRGGGDLRSDNPIIGSWAGDRIVIAGDYAKAGDPAEPKKGVNLYSRCGGEGGEFTDVSDLVIEALLEDKWLRKDFVESVRSQAKYDPEGTGSTGLSKVLWPGLREEVLASAPEEPAAGEVGSKSLRPDILIVNKG